MRRLAAGAAILIVMVGIQADPGRTAEVSFQTGFHYDWWRSDNGSWGQQILVPYSTEVDIQDLSVKVLGGYAYTSTRVEIPDDSLLRRLFGARDRVTSVVSGVVDTKANLSYDFAERLPVGLLVGLDFNFPTGDTRFRSRQDAFLVLDPDLVSVSNLGEGFNVNPSIILTKEWSDQWATGIGFGYAWRGDYNRYLFPQILGPGIFSNPLLREIDPGDVLSVTPEVRYYLNDAWHARLFFNYSHFWPQEVDGKDAFEPGEYYMAGVGVNYEQGKWASHLNLTAIFRGDPGAGTNGVLGGVTALTNVNPFAEGDEVVAELGAGYSFNDQTTLKSQLTLRYLYDADPPESSSQAQFFISQRKLVSLQIGLVRKLIPHLEAELSVKGLYMNDEQTVMVRDVLGRQDKDYTDNDFAGFSTGIRLTGTF